MSKESLCSSCSNAIFCNTWTEWKCLVKKKRIYDYEDMLVCKSYNKKPNHWKEVKCRCKFCLANEGLIDELEEGGDE